MGSYGTPDLGTGRRSDAEFYKCKKCGQEYYKSWSRCPRCRTLKGKGTSVRPIFWLLLIFTICFAYIYTNPIINKNFAIIGNDIANTNNTTETFNQEIKNLVPVEAPKTGIYQLYTTSELIAPFEIRNHNDNKAYLFKFNDSKNNSTVFTVFLNKNENCNTKVPLGTYEITYVTGDTWFGDQELFGIETIYNKYRGTYNFYIDNTSYKGQGHYIDMTPQINGNLNSDYISKDEW